MLVLRRCVTHVGGGSVAILYRNHELRASSLRANTQVIVTSALFPGGKFAEDVLREMSQKVGKERLVVDIR